jgi:hypothetical protein
VPAYKKPTRHADLLSVLCPITKCSITTHIERDVRTLVKSWHSKIIISCPHCTEVHKFRACEAFVESAISNARLRGELYERESPKTC